MDTLAEGYEPLGNVKDSHGIDNLVHTVNVGIAGNQHFNAANAVDLFNEKYGIDAVEAIQNVNTMETLEPFDGLFLKAPLSWTAQKTQFEEALEQIEAIKGASQIQEQLRHLEETIFSGNKNFDKVIKALDGKHIKGSQETAEKTIKTIKKAVIKTYDKTHATLTDQASKAATSFMKTVGKTALSKAAQPVLRNALEGLEISEACAELSANTIFNKY